MPRPRAQTARACGVQCATFYRLRRGLAYAAGIRRAYFEAGQPLQVETYVETPGGFEGITVRLIYRHVNQEEYFQVQEMPSKLNRYDADIPRSYTKSPHALQYFFELRTGDGLAWLFPGLGAHLSKQPYFVAQRT